MKRTSAVLIRVAGVVGLGVAASTAHAIPMVFDFTGTARETFTTDSVNFPTGVDLSLMGQAVTGRIVIELSGLEPTESVDSWGTAINFVDLLGQSDPITSELSIGGVSYDAGAFSGDSGGIFALDGNGSERDRLSISDRSTDYWVGDGVAAPGEYSRHSLTLGWSDPSNPVDFIDLSNGFQPLDLIQWVSTLVPSGSYTTSRMNCADSLCTTFYNAQTYFTIDSLTVSTPSVPEPGTLALFAVGLLGGAVARRSAVKAR